MKLPAEAMEGYHPWSPADEAASIELEFQDSCSCRYLPFHSAPLSWLLLTSYQFNSFVSSKMPVKAAKLFETHYLRGTTAEGPLGSLLCVLDSRVLRNPTPSPIGFVTPTLVGNHKRDGSLAYEVRPHSLSRNIALSTCTGGTGTAPSIPGNGLSQ